MSSFETLGIIHVADIHWGTERTVHVDRRAWPQRSLAMVGHTAMERDADAIVIAGDLSHKPMLNTEEAGLPALHQQLQWLTEFAPVFFVPGNHDAGGSWRVFEEMRGRHQFVFVDPRHAYFLLADGLVVRRDLDDESPAPEGARLLVLGMGTPTTTHYLRNKSARGKQQAEDEVMEQARGILLGHSAYRRIHPSLPAISILHAFVRGSTLSTDSSKPIGGIELDVADIEQLDVDYVALGDVHRAQQVTDRAWYAGDLYPDNWGELEQKSFNVVTFGYEIVDDETGRSTFEPDVQQVALPHPPRRKVVWPWGESLPVEEYRGYQTWLVYEAHPEEARHINREQVCEELVADGALPGSRVTVSVIPIETMRAGEIRDAKTLAAKLALWAEWSRRDLPDGVIEKARQVEADFQTKRVAPAPARWRLKSAGVRGSKGIRYGTGEDEVFLDLDLLEPGVILLPDPNGTGKTSLIENCQPFPDLLTREGALYHHFRLQDSFRELVYVDDLTGSEYRLQIQIDPDREACAYHIYQDDVELMDDAKQGTYLRLVNHLFGSKSMLLFGAFMAQRPVNVTVEGESGITTELLYATPKMRKALIAELTGLGNLEAYARFARDLASDLENEIERQHDRVSWIETVTKTLPEKQDELEETEAGLTTGRGEADDAAAELQDLERSEREASEAAQAAAAEQARVEQLGRQCQTLLDEHERLTHEALAFNEARDLREDTQELIEQYEKLKTEERRLQDENEAIGKEREEKLAKFRSEEDAHRDHAQQLSDGRHQAEAAIAEKTAELRGERKLLERLLSGDDDVECPKCGHSFSPDHAHREEAIAEREAAIAPLAQELGELEIDRDEASARLRHLAEPLRPPLPEPNDTAPIRRQLEGFDITALRERLQRADRADVEISQAKTRCEEIRTQRDELLQQINETTLDPEAAAKLETAKGNAAAKREDLENVRGDIAALEATEKQLQRQIEEGEEQLEEAESLKSQIEQGTRNAEEWQLLAAGVGRDGVQALELQAVEPTVTQVANDLLEAGYGSRFRITFELTKDTGEGSEKKQAETFEILVYDEESEESAPKKLEDLSGGQYQWIKRALLDAFQIIREQNTGLSFATVFLDESDGQLDPDARVRYLRMIERAHTTSGRHHTLVVTHSETVHQMFAQQLRLADLVVEGEREEVPA